MSPSQSGLVLFLVNLGSRRRYAQACAIRRYDWNPGWGRLGNSDIIASYGDNGEFGGQIKWVVVEGRRSCFRTSQGRIENDVKEG